MSDPFESPLESLFGDAESAWRVPDNVIPNHDTVRALRAIGGNGEVTSKELLALAYYLNEHREARHSWPGEQLLRILVSMFDGHTPSLGDRERIHSHLAAIERECARVAVDEGTREPALPLSAIRVEDFTLPASDRTVEIECADSGMTFRADLRHQSCSCPAWPNHRSRLKPNDPRRCCAHLVEAYHRLIKTDELPEAHPIFKDLMADRAHRGRSLDTHAQWKLVKIRMRPHIIIYGDNKEWSYAYAPDGTGYTRFAFHNTEKRWSFGQQPQSAATIEAFLEEARNGRIN